MSEIKEDQSEFSDQYEYYDPYTINFFVFLGDYSKKEKHNVYPNLYGNCTNIFIHTLLTYFKD